MRVVRDLECTLTFTVAYLVSALLLCVELLGFSSFLSLEAIQARQYGVMITRLHAHKVAGCR